MSSESSSTSSKIRQFGLYRTIDQRTEEFLKLSRKRQIRQGCACAAVSTAITVTIVVIFVLIYIFPGNIDRQKQTPTFNWPGLVNDTDNDIYNKAKTIASINPAAVRLLPILIKLLQNQQSSNELLKPQNETKWKKEEKRNDYQQKRKKFTPEKEIKSYYAKQYTVNNKGKPFILYKRPIENTDYYAQMRKLKHYRAIINYLNNMISRKAETRNLSVKTTEQLKTDKIKSTLKKQITTNVLKTNKLTNCSDMQVKNNKQITTTTDKSTTNGSKSTGSNKKHTKECLSFRPANVDGLLIDLILNIKKLLLHYEKDKIVNEDKHLQTTTTRSHHYEEILTTSTDYTTYKTSVKTTTENIFEYEPTQNSKFDQENDQLRFQLSSNIHNNYEFDLQNISLWSTEITTRKDTSNTTRYKGSMQALNYYDIFHSNLLNETQIETTSIPETTETIAPSETVEPTESNALTESIDTARSNEEDNEKTQSPFGTSMDHDRISFKRPGGRGRLMTFPFWAQNASSGKEKEQEHSANTISIARSNISVTAEPDHTSIQVNKYNKSENSKESTSAETPSSASIFLRKMGKYITPLDKVAFRKHQNKSKDANDKSCENPPGDYDDQTTKNDDEKFAQYSEIKDDQESREDSSYLRHQSGLVKKESKDSNDKELVLRPMSMLPQGRPVYLNILRNNWDNK